MYIPPDFYKKVENLSYLNHIAYGDSVAADTTIPIKYNPNFYIPPRFPDCKHVVSFENLWNKLEELGLKKQIINNKEYIFLNNEIMTDAYNYKKDIVELNKVDYIMRHKINKKIIKCSVDLMYINPQYNRFGDYREVYSFDYAYLVVTKDHSMLNYNYTTHEFDIFNANDIEYIPRTHTAGRGLYYGETDYTKDVNCAKIHNIFPHKVEKREIDYDGYVYDLEIPELHNFIANGFLVHNTDSIMFTVPVANVDKLSLEETWNLANTNSVNINNLIRQLDSEIIMKKCNIDDKHSNVWFKTEYVMSGMLFLDIKKSYSYKTILKDGIEYNRIEHKGFPIVKSNYSIFTKQILKEMIENILLNETIPMKDKYDKIIEIIIKFKKRFDEDMALYKFDFVGTPGKWNKQKQIIDGMTLYNNIINKKVFSFGSSGKFIYCTFDNKEKFPDLKGITVPYEYNNNQLKLAMEENRIVPDNAAHWNRIFDKICVKIKDFSKQLSGKGLFDRNSI